MYAPSVFTESASSIPATWTLVSECGVVVPAHCADLAAIGAGAATASVGACSSMTGPPRQ